MYKLQFAVLHNGHPVSDVSYWKITKCVSVSFGGTQYELWTTLYVC